MKGFNFKLQKLLDIRLDKEEQCKIGFQVAEREKSKVEDSLKTLNGEYSKYNVLKKQETLIEQKIRNNYLNVLSFKIEDTEEVLKEKEVILIEKRGELIESQIDRKTVEILKEKKKKEFIKNEEKKEQNFIDELALYSYIRTHERR
ncbi:flagellar export protein FliJ [Clostridium hydrogeniformans]|uniref:flagellar export protein FliJ n=1 Tax=Clostridium hydrogeniformans TaxID=349933 RepID=UPI00047F45C0|nr:flagellar export protein FliJ [Clostridium hydrogeniformans]